MGDGAHGEELEFESVETTAISFADAAPDHSQQGDLRAVLLFRIGVRIPSDGKRGSDAHTEKSTPVVAVFVDGEAASQLQAGQLRQLLSTEQAQKALARIVGAPHDKLEFYIGEMLSGPPGRIATPLKIAFRTEGKIVFIDPADVIAIEAQGNYVLLQTRSSSHLLRESVSTVARRLERYGFVRIHRSTVVNGALAEEVQISGSGEMLLRVKGGSKEYSVSRKYRGALRSISPCWI
ncbi:MAG TPA: LytTR family DNA-binding domain-containing protein [Candidatus Acidoferrum sp.]|nr:LytTR family DNA-binding domain-containing protein [Candidatus Acidoferrum sp.]